MRSFSLIISSLMAFSGFASTPVMDITGPNGLLNVKVELNDGTPTYTVDYNGKVMLESSPLGVVTSIADLSKNLKLANTDFSVISDTYTIDRAKKSTVNYSANEGVLTFVNPENETLKVVFRVSDNDVAFRYELPAGKKRYCVIERENTGFDFPSYATTYITPQSLPMVGWENTKPSYEEEYTINEPIGTKSSNGVGYTFPALFKIGEDGWALVSETGVDSKYAGTRLGESSPEGLYMVEFPYN